MTAILSLFLLPWYSSTGTYPTRMSPSWVSSIDEYRIVMVLLLGMDEEEQQEVEHGSRKESNKSQGAVTATSTTTPTPTLSPAKEGEELKDGATIHASIRAVRGARTSAVASRLSVESISGL